MHPHPGMHCDLPASSKSTCADKHAGVGPAAPFPADAVLQGDMSTAMAALVFLLLLHLMIYLCWTLYTVAVSNSCMPDMLTT